MANYSRLSAAKPAQLSRVELFANFLDFLTMLEFLSNKLTLRFARIIMQKSLG